MAMNTEANGAPVDEFLPTRNSLLSRLRDWDDRESWLAFFDTYWKFLLSIAVKSGLSDEDARDVVQETVVAVAKGLREGRFQRTAGGSFKAWLQLIVRRRVIDHLRRAKTRQAVQTEALSVMDLASLAEGIPDPAGQVVDELWDDEWNRNLADAALERVKQRVGAKQFQMFDLYVVKSWPVGEVARTLHVNVAQVYLAKHRVTSMIRQETEKLRRRMERDGGFTP
jgi:RNA polymerase sigma factor (sigma-70 family)